MICSSGYLSQTGLPGYLKKCAPAAYSLSTALFLWLAFLAVFWKIVGQYSKFQVFSRLNTNLEWILA
jgi:hypothetical protein